MVTLDAQLGGLLSCYALIARTGWTYDDPDPEPWRRLAARVFAARDPQTAFRERCLLG